MIEQQARILSVEHGLAQVSVGPQSGCSACDAGQGCGAGLFGRLLRRKPISVVLPNPGGFRAGQSVVLAVSELFYLRLVARLYALPLASGLVAAWLCHQIGKISGSGRGVTDLLALAGLAGGIWLVMALGRKSKDMVGVESMIQLRQAVAPARCASAENLTRDKGI